MAAAIVPFRAGSKGVPGKNVRDVAGKPLWRWSLDAAVAATSIGRVIVTTDYIDEDSRHLIDVDVPFKHWVRRPEELASDSAALDDALIHAIDTVQLPDDATVVVLQPTAPVRRSGLIDDCVRTFKSFPEGKSLVTANRLHFVWHGDGGRLLNPPRVERQKMDSTQFYFEEDGAVFVVRAGDLRATGSRVIDPVVLFETERTVDIDTPADLALAEHLLSR